MKKIKLFFVVLSLSILCGCGVASDEKVETPDSLKACVDGEYAYIVWSEGKNATGYECNFGADIYQTTECNFQLQGLAPGSTTVIQVRAYNDTEETPVYSEWKTLNITMPEINLNNLSPDSAGALSRSMFEKWVANNKLKYEMAETDECYIYTLKFEDEDNDGLWEAIKRSGKAAINDFVSGYVESVENEISDGETILKGIFENKGIEEYIEDVDDSATFEGGWRAATSAWAAMKVDPGYVYVYYFGKDSAQKSAIFYEKHFLKKHHENYAKEIAKEIKTKTINGENYYAYTASDCGRQIYFAVGTEKVQGVDRWVEYGYADGLYFE